MTWSKIWRVIATTNTCVSCVAAQRWELHVKSTGAPTRPSAALVALRAWAGINRKARYTQICAVSHSVCMHLYPQQLHAHKLPESQLSSV